MLDSTAVSSAPGKSAKLFPAFRFDTERREVRPIVADINRAIGTKDDPWGAARRPQCRAHTPIPPGVERAATTDSTQRDFP